MNPRAPSPALAPAASPAVSAAAPSATPPSLRLRLRLALVVLCVLVAVGQAACPAETVRQLTYPPSFQYIEKERLQDAMWALARAVQALDDTLRTDATALPPAERLAEVDALLTEIQEISGRVSAPGQDTNHPMLDRHLDRFQLDLALARTALEFDPPDYSAAGRVTGACLYCHVGGGGGPLRR